MKPDKTSNTSRARQPERCRDNAALVRLADVVRSARIGLGLTQEKLALASAVSRDTVIALESASTDVSLGSALRIIEGLRLTIAPAPVIVHPSGYAEVVSDPRDAEWFLSRGGRLASDVAATASEEPRQVPKSGHKRRRKDS